MYITMNSARIPKESTIHCYSIITGDRTHQNQSAIFTTSQTFSFIVKNIIYEIHGLLGVD